MEWMGKPDRVEENTSIAGRSVDAVLVYKSSPRAVQGVEDIWVALDKGGRVLVVYYPDWAHERTIIKGVLTETEGRVGDQ